MLGRQRSWNLRLVFVLVVLGTLLAPGSCLGAAASEASEDKSADGAGPSRAKPSIVVAGVRSEVRDPKFRDKQIGFGIDAYIAEELGKADLFRFFEEDAAIVERIKTVQEKVWMLRDEFQKADLVRISTEVKTDIFAYGRVVRMKERRVRTFAGPANVMKKIGEVRIEVSLYFRETGEVLSATGTGKSSKGLWGFIAQGRPEALDFDDYMVGQASKEAVTEAVKKLIKQYKARKGPDGKKTGKNRKETGK